MSEQKNDAAKVKGDQTDPALEQNQSEKPMSFLGMVMLTGFIGGLLWSSMAYLCYYFSFTKLEPNIIFEPWAAGDWRERWIGIILSIVAYGIISIGIALVYYGVLRKFKSMWVGACYGIVLFLTVFLLLKPLFPSIKSFTAMDYHTLITSLCIYILYGVFIGYSISYEENELRHEEQKEKSGEMAR
ncbi:YqhR family membrane protein [Lysinibacillus sphaericus]